MKVLYTGFQGFNNPSKLMLIVLMKIRLSLIISIMK